MRWPRTLTIRGDTWCIYHSKRRPRWAIKGSVGTVERSPELRRIWVKESGNIEEDLCSLWHEVLHTIFPQGMMTDEFEDAMVSALERGLASVARDNDLSFCRVKRSAT